MTGGTSRGNFAVGMFAWLFNPVKKKEMSPKLMCRWEGPFFIVNRLSDVTLRIQRKQGGKMKVIYCDRLKPWISETGGRGQETQEQPAGNIPEMEVDSSPNGIRPEFSTRDTV